MPRWLNLRTRCGLRNVLLVTLAAETLSLLLRIHMARQIETPMKHAGPVHVSTFVQHRATTTRPAHIAMSTFVQHRGTTTRQPHITVPTFVRHRATTTRSAHIAVKSARNRHPCRKHFIDICGKTGKPTLHKGSLIPGWPKPLPIHDLRKAVAQHNERQQKACLGRLTNPRLLIFGCSNDPNRPFGSPCHALADGIRGVTLAFVIALIEKRSFFMHTLNWLPFEKFFPSRLNYRLENCSALMKLNLFNETNESVVQYNLREDPSADCKKISSAELLNSPDQVVSMNSNHVSECWYRLLKEAGYSIELFKHESVMRLVFETLFDFPGPVLGDMLQSFTTSQKVDFARSVCLHVRSGSFTGIDDGCFYRNIDDVWRCARAMEMSSNALSGLKNITWVLIGDNDLHKQMALDYMTKCSDPLFRQSSVNRRIVDTSAFGHLQTSEYGGSAKMDGLRRVFFDLLVMSRCRHLVGTASGYNGLAAVLHHDCSERRYLRVKKTDKPSDNMDYLCVPIKPCY